MRGLIYYSDLRGIHQSQSTSAQRRGVQNRESTESRVQAECRAQRRLERRKDSGEGAEGVFLAGRQRQGWLAGGIEHRAFIPCLSVQSLFTLHTLLSTGYSLSVQSRLLSVDYSTTEYTLQSTPYTVHCNLSTGYSTGYSLSSL